MKYNINWKNRKTDILLMMLFFLFLSFFSIYFTHLLNGKIVVGDDIAFHKNRIEGLYDALSNGVWFPRLNMIMMNSMGYASSIFYSDFFLYIPAFFRLIGLSVSESYIGFMVAINFITFVTAFYSFYSVKKSLANSFLFSILFTTAPYRLLDLTTRAALGELLALAFLPLAFAGLYHIIYGDFSKWYYLTLGMTFIIYSHILSALMFALLIAMFLLVNVKSLLKQKERIRSFLYSVLLTVVLTIAYFIPIIEQTLSQSFKVGNAPIFYMSEKAVDFGHFIESSLSNKVTPNLGILLLLCLFIYGANVGKLRDKKSKDIIFIAFLLLTMVTNLFPWKLLDGTPLNTIQFPWRFLGFISLLTSWIVAEDPFDWLSNHKKKVASICFLSLFLLTSYTVNIRTNAADKEIESYRVFNEMDLSYLGAGKEYLPQSSDYEKLKEQSIQPKYNAKDVKVSDYTKNRDNISFTFDSQIEQKITLPLIYYKGYVAEVSGNGSMKQPFLDESENGQLSVTVKGTGEAVVQYQDTLLQTISLSISVLGWLAFVIYRSYRIIKK